MCPSIRSSMHPIHLPCPIIPTDQSALSVQFVRLTIGLGRGLIHTSQNLGGSLIEMTRHVGLFRIRIPYPYCPYYMKEACGSTPYSALYEGGMWVYSVFRIPCKSILPMCCFIVPLFYMCIMFSFVVIVCLLGGWGLFVLLIFVFLCCLFLYFVCVLFGLWLCYTMLFCMVFLIMCCCFCFCICIEGCR